MAYEHTSVDTMKSWGEICRVLYSHGVEATRYTENSTGIVIEFVRIVKAKDGTTTKRVVKMPVYYDFKGLDTPAKQDQEKRTKWRSLFYYIKATFDAIDQGIVGYEQAFLADTVLLLPSGVSVRVIEAMRPSLKSNCMDPFVPLLEPPEEREAQTVEYRRLPEGGQ